MRHSGARSAVWGSPAVRRRGLGALGRRQRLCGTADVWVPWLLPFRGSGWRHKIFVVSVTDTTSVRRSRPLLGEEGAAYTDDGGKMKNTRNYGRTTTGGVVVEKTRKDFADPKATAAIGGVVVVRRLQRACESAAASAKVVRRAQRSAMN